MTATLEQIIEHKRREVEAGKARRGLAEMRAAAEQAESPRNFFAAVFNHPTPVHMSVIAEIKRKSPSAGWIRDEYRPRGEPASNGQGPESDADAFEPEHIARRYFANGAAAISCLTDETFFGGHLTYIKRVKDAVPLPVLRKDFVIDPWQLYETRAAGADAVLLIAECLTEGELVDMLILAQQLRLTTLLEVHSVDSLLRVRPHVGFPHRAYALLGINNRDLATMTTDLKHTLRLLDMVDDRAVLVSESGIRRRADLDRLRLFGVRIVLVGEGLMAEPDPGAALAELLGRRPK